MWKDTDPKTWVFKDAKVINQRTQQAQVYIDASSTDRARPSIQLEKMMTPWGFELDEGETVEKVLETGEKMKLRIKFNVASPEFGQFIESLDQLTVTKALEQRWWPTGKYPGDDKVRADHKPVFLKDKNDGRYPDKVKLRVNIAGPRVTKVFIAEGPGTWRTGQVTDIVPGIEALPIVEIAGVWVSGVGFGIDLLATKMLLYPRTDLTPEFSFVLPTPMVEASSDGPHIDESVAASGAASNKRARDDGDEAEPTGLKVAKQEL